MRKLLLSLLLAGVAATPAFADPDHNDRHDNQARAERQAERQQARSERSAPAERPHFNGGGNGGGQPQFVRSERFQQNVQQGDAAQAEQFRAAERARMRAFNGGDRDGGRRNGFQGQQTVTDGSLRQQDRPLPQVMQRRDRSPMVGDASRQDSQRWQRDGNWRRGQISWNRDWRNDRRYDWRNYRNRHRSTFHLGIYYDPFGYNYQPFGIGFQLAPAYFGQNYWIDPSMYELPYPPPGAQWVRYWNDAVLVDMYSGQVIDVIQGFFW